MREIFPKKTELYDYDVYPKVIETGLAAEITVRPQALHRAFVPGAEYRIEVLPLLFRAAGEPYSAIHTATPDSRGALVFRHTFATEQEYYIRIFRNDSRIIQLSVYAVDNDLAGRYPYMGDLHVHSCRSDGREAPAMVAASYRRMGYDFMGLTDHHRYYPSLEAMDVYKDVKLGLKLFPGEEVHLPYTNVHIVNFGGSYSVNGLLPSSAQYKEKGDSPAYRALDPESCPQMLTPEEYKDELDKIISENDIPDDVDKTSWAVCVWAFDRIRRGGGLAIFPHPYWISDLYQIPWQMTEALFRSGRMDAFEVLGGERYLNQNENQTIHYYEAREKGLRFPVVGSSDSHGTINNPNVNIGQTMVFAPSLDRKRLLDSIRGYYSVAIDHISPEYRLVGEHRLTLYARFLLDEYIPLHDDLCFEEGRLMQAYAADTEEGAGESLSALADRTEKLARKYFRFK